MHAVVIQILIAFAASFIARILVGAGLTIFTYKLIGDFVIQLQNELSKALYALPSDALAFIHMIKFDFYLSAVISAYGIVAFIKCSKIFIGKK